jgi:5-oxoprolinase (ATP-hydrolysing) subunit A
MERIIDLNSDIGESFGVWTLGDDARVLDCVTSANVACGFHAGDPHVMLQTVHAARERGVAIGAHPGYPDLVGFGRRSMTCSAEEVYAFCLYQIGALAAICRAEGVPLCHVKPHGALYNQSCSDGQLARAIALAVHGAAPDLILLGLAGTEHEAAARDIGVRFAAEAFADRAYQPDGSLVPRSRTGSILHDPAMIAARVIQMVSEGTVEADGGGTIPLRVDSICVHGDNPAACQVVAAVRSALDKTGTRVRSLREVLSP